MQLIVTFLKPLFFKIVHRCFFFPIMRRIKTFHSEEDKIENLDDNINLGPVDQNEQ